jgi:hypothetical protein
MINAKGQWARGDVNALLTTQNGSYEAPAFNLTDTDGGTEDLQDRCASRRCKNKSVMNCQLRALDFC